MSSTERPVDLVLVVSVAASEPHHATRKLPREFEPPRPPPRRLATP